MGEEVQSKFGIICPLCEEGKKAPVTEATLKDTFEFVEVDELRVEYTHQYVTFACKCSAGHEFERDGFKCVEKRVKYKWPMWVPGPFAKFIPYT